MSGDLGATLAKPVGPLPLGVWLLVGAGGLVIAARTSREDKLTREVQQIPVPVGAIAAPDGAPGILNVVVELPPGYLGPNGGGGGGGGGGTLPNLPNLPSFPDGGTVPIPTVPPAAPLPIPTQPDIPVPRPPVSPGVPAAVGGMILKPSGVVAPSLNPFPVPTSKPPAGGIVTKDGSGREWVANGYVWNRNTGVWQRR